MLWNKEAAHRWPAPTYSDTSGPVVVVFKYWLHQNLWLWITTDCVKFFKRWKYQTTLPASWEMCMQVKKQQLELDMEQQTGSKSGKACIKAVYCHLLI